MITIKAVTFEDLYEFNFLSGINCSPDKNHAVFIKANADKNKKGYRNEIWVLDLQTKQYRKLANSGEDKNAQWLDDENVVFISQRDKKADCTQFYKINIHKGEAEKFFEVPYKVNSYSVLNDGIFMLNTAKSCETSVNRGEDEAEDGKDVLVFDEIYFWFNNLGIRNKIRNSILLFDVKNKCEKQITSQYFSVSELSVSKDKKKILYCGCNYTDVFIKETGLFLYNIEDNSTTELVPQGKFAVSSPIFMGDNNIFYEQSPLEFPGQNPYFFTKDLISGETVQLPYLDFPLEGSAGTDCNLGGGTAKRFHNGFLYATRSLWGDSFIYRMDRSGNWENITKTNGSVIHFDITDKEIIMTAMRGTNLVEIYCLNLQDGKEKQLTDFNLQYCSTHSISCPEAFKFTNSDGIELEGYVIKPIDYRQGNKYPAIFEIHGGPKGIYGSVFHHEMQIFANMGYFVFYTNPRGSDGRGSDFANMKGNLGKNDFKDLMEFFDEVLKRNPDIDEKHVGICGGSYGGFMCNWMIGHTDRFAAAASQRSISNYLTKALTTDNGFAYNMTQLDTTPWDNFEKVWNTSPLKNAPKAKTPTLFIQSDEDYRCWMSEPLQMYTALKLNGTDTRIAFFKGENHELSRSGKPNNRINRLKEICRWFEIYLKA